jgi:hypothetical protein
MTFMEGLKWGILKSNTAARLRYCQGESTYTHLLMMLLLLVVLLAVGVSEVASMSGGKVVVEVDGDV